MEVKTKYVEVASGSVSNRGKVMQLSELRDFIQKAENEREIYHSWYCFDINLKHHIEKTKTIQNYKGVYDINQIILDFDKANLNDRQLLDSMRYFIDEELINNYRIPDDYYNIWYSGTGFHIHLANCFGFTSDVYLPGVVKTTLSDLFPEADSIFDGARLIRAGNTINRKSGFYKTEIKRDELFTLDMKAIQSIASEPKKSSYHGLWFDQEIMIEPILAHLIKKPRAITSPIAINKNKFKGDPSAIVTCMQKAYEAGPVHGQRNETMVRLASWLKRNGTPRIVVELGLKVWSGLEREAENVTNSVFSENFGAISCEDQIMSQWCDPKCIYYRRKDYSLDIKGTEQLEESYQEWIKQDFKDKSFDFSEAWDTQKKYMVLPGELVIVLGDTGLGKTAFVQNLVSRLPHMSCLFLSLELHSHLMFRRFCQITHGLDKNTVDEACKDKEQKSTFGREFKQIQVLSDPIDISRLEKVVAEMRPKILVVDTTDALMVDRIYNEFDKMNTIINTLKKIAISQDMIVIGVHHVNKESAKNNETNLHSAKGSSTVVQKADKVLVINGNRDQLIRYVWSEKSRDENTIKMKFEFQPKTFKWDLLPA